MNVKIKASVDVEIKIQQSKSQNHQIQEPPCRRNTKYYLLYHIRLLPTPAVAQQYSPKKQSHGQGQFVLHHRQNRSESIFNYSNVFGSRWSCCKSTEAKKQFAAAVEIRVHCNKSSGVIWREVGLTNFTLD